MLNEKMRYRAKDFRDVLSGVLRESSMFWKNCSISAEPVFIGRIASRIRFPISSLYWLGYSVLGLDTLISYEHIHQLLK